MPLSKSQIEEALSELAAELPGHLKRVELLLVGGAAMVLLFDARPSTKDIDVVPLDAAGGEEIRLAATRVAKKLSLPNDWLNDAAKGYLHGISTGRPVFESASLHVKTPSLHQLLAMKLSAWRDDIDIADARLLLQNLSGDADSIWAQVEPHIIPGRELKAKFAFDDLMQE